MLMLIVTLVAIDVFLATLAVGETVRHNNAVRRVDRMAQTDAARLDRTCGLIKRADRNVLLYGPDLLQRVQTGSQTGKREDHG